MHKILFNEKNQIKQFCPQIKSIAENKQRKQNQKITQATLMSSRINTERKYTTIWDFWLRAYTQVHQQS